MRNLKRALSLTLASVMLLGMMVVGAGAAGYKDVTDDHNVEAIEVLQAVGAMIGDEAGNFDPDANVNRAQIATIMSRLLDLKVEDFNAADIPFTDVPEWAVPFVAACYADGITSGISATAFGSSNNVTAAQAALMMMKALGYFQYQDDFGDDWQLATIKQASEIGLFYGVTVDRTSPLTRNDVAQMALNALKSNMVAFTGEVGSVYEVNGATIRVGYKPEYTIRTSADPIYRRIDNLATTIDKPTGQYEMQLGEYLYGGDLKLTSATDVFGRPARYWEFEGEEIGTYVKEELLKSQYTTSVTGKALYDLLGSATLKDYELNVTIDGESDPEVFGGYTNDYDRQDYYTIFNATHLNRNNDKSVGGTGNGVLTQVFVDTNDKTVYIAVINTYLAFADDDYDEKKEQVGLDVYDILVPTGYKNTYIKDVSNTLGTKMNITVTAEEFDIADVVKGDYFLVTVADGAIQSMRTPDVLSAVEISSFSKGNSLTTGGTKYDYADTLSYDSKTLANWTGVDNKVNLKDMTYDVYLDQYGYAIGVKESEAPKNYMFITGVNGNFNNLVNINLEANAIFLDGTMETIKINGRKSDFQNLATGVDSGATVNRWFTYTKGSNGVYNVTLVNYGVNGATGQFHENRDGSQNPIDYKKHNVMVNDNNDLYSGTTVATNHIVYSNDDTVFLTVGLDNLNTSAEHYAAVISDVESVSVGIDNVDITPWNHEFVKNLNNNTGDPSWKVIDNDGEDKPTDTDGTDDLWCDHSYGVYALYDSEGYIIAMVVVGQDNGMGDNLVYIDNSSVKDESYDKATEKWTWTRNAIVNGERVLLTEVNDTGISLLEKMNNGKWYRVRYNAQGEVTGVSAHNSHDADCEGRGNDVCLDFDKDYTSDWRLNTAPYAYVTNYKYWSQNGNRPNGETDNAIYEAINSTGVNVVLYHEKFMNESMTNSGHTLYLTTTDKEASGVRYTEDTNVVFIQTERNKSYTEFWKGQSGVEKALKALHPTNKYETKTTYDYEISVTWKDGRATAIIIRDLNLQGTDGWWDTTREGDVYFEDTKDMDWEARYLSILDNANAYVTDQGEGRFFFHMVYRPDGKTNEEIFDGDGNAKNGITYWYKVFVERDGKTYQIGSTYEGEMVRDLTAKGNFVYKGEVEKLGHAFSTNEKLYIAIVEVFNGTKKPDGTPNPGLPVETDDTKMPDNVDATKITFEGENDSSVGDGKLSDANQGEKVRITIPVTAAKGKAAGSLVEGSLESGKSYYVKVNGVNDGPATLTGGKLVVTHTITADDIKTAGKLLIQGIYADVEEPEKPVEPGTKVSEIAVTMDKVTVGETLPTPVVGDTMTLANAAWTPDETAAYGKTYTLTFDVTLKDDKAEWDETVTVKGLEGATAVVKGDTVTVTYTVSTEADPTQSIDSVTVSDLPAEIFVGDEVTVSVTAPANVTGTATVDTKTAGEVTVELTITTEHAKGFAAGLTITGWEVKNGPVSDGAKTATFTKTVTVKEKVDDKVTEVDAIAFDFAKAVTIGETLPAPVVSTEGLEIVDKSAKWSTEKGDVAEDAEAAAETEYTLTFNVAIADETTHAWKTGDITVTGPKDGTTTSPATDNKDDTYAVTYTVTTGKDGDQTTETTYTVKIGSETLTYTSETALDGKAVEFTSNAQSSSVEAGTYMLEDDITDGYVAKDGAETATVGTPNEAKVSITVPAKVFTEQNNNTITLVPVVEITVADKAGLGIVVGEGAEALTEGDYYFVKDTEVTFNLKDSSDKTTVWKVSEEETDTDSTDGIAYTPAKDGTVTFLKAVGEITYSVGSITTSTNEEAVKGFFTGDGVGGVSITVTGLEDLTQGETSNITVTITAQDGYYFTDGYKIDNNGIEDKGGVPTITITIAETVGE